jgi:hypothetical protein
MVESYIAYRILYIVCEEPEKNGIEMMVREDPFLPVERPKEVKNRRDSDLVVKELLTSCSIGFTYGKEKKNEGTKMYIPRHKVYMYFQTPMFSLSRKKDGPSPMKSATFSWYRIFS